MSEEESKPQEKPAAKQDLVKDPETGKLVTPGMLKVVPYGEQERENAEFDDDQAWFEPEEGKEDSDAFTTTIEHRGKKFWIRELSRAKKKLIKAEFKVIAKRSEELQKVFRKANALRKLNEEGKTLEGESYDSASSEGMRIMDDLEEKQIGLYDMTLTYALKFWERKGSREPLTREQILKFYPSHKAALYDSVMQKSTIGRAEGKD